MVARRTAGLNTWSHWGTLLAETNTKILLTLAAIVLFRLLWRGWSAALLVGLPLILEASVFLRIVAWCRMYRGMHFLSDVIIGSLLGLTSVVVTTWLVRTAERRRDREGVA